MSTENRRSSASTSPGDEAVVKRPWHPPTLEEIDYSETQQGVAQPNANFDGLSYET